MTFSKLCFEFPRMRYPNPMTCTYTALRPFFCIEKQCACLLVDDLVTLLRQVPQEHETNAKDQGNYAFCATKNVQANQVERAFNENFKCSKLFLKHK